MVPSGLTAYNHNLDTSREFYPKVRGRLGASRRGDLDLTHPGYYHPFVRRTARHHRCSPWGGYQCVLRRNLGSWGDRRRSDWADLGAVQVLPPCSCFTISGGTDYYGTSGSLPEHPESFPVNALVPIPGTPLEKNDVNPIAVFLRPSGSWC